MWPHAMRATPTLGQTVGCRKKRIHAPCWEQPGLPTRTSTYGGHSKPDVIADAAVISRRSDLDASILSHTGISWI
jgi:hypothetical protein